MKKIAILTLVVLVCAVSILVSGVYIPNNRDTLRAPEKLEVIEFDSTNYNLLVEYENLAYYYRHETDVIAIKDKQTGYTWKSGIDYTSASQNNAKFNQAVKDFNNGVITKEELEAIASVPNVNSMTDTRLALANSLVTLEYFTKTDSTIKSSSISATDSKIDSSSRTLQSDSLNKEHFVYNVDFTTIDVSIRVDLYLGEKGLSYEIRDESIVNNSTNVHVANIVVMPYLGAQGGEIQNYKLVEYYNEITGFTSYSREMENVEELKMNDGYSFIPDGSGALVRFRNNTQTFSPIHLPVYGVNYSTASKYVTEAQVYDTNQYASMPVFGMAVGNNDSAFVSFTTKGDNYMTISAYPDGSENGIQYNRTYAKYNYNNEFSQVLNGAGQSYASLQKDRYHYDVYTTINFLSKEDANYLGMAENYREYLMENNLLFDTKANATDIPLHLDFLMADSQKSVFGYENVVMTTTNDVKDILNDVTSNGIKNINSSLLGFDDGGLTLGAVDKINFTSSIGSKSAHKNLITEFAEQQIDISLMLDYYEINTEVIGSYNNATKHLNGLYTLYKDRNKELIKDITFLRPDKAYQYASKNIPNVIKDTKSSSISLSGITSNRISHENNEINSDMKYYDSILKLSSDAADVNAVKPNSYLWKYVTRYLNADPYNSQFLAETDTVPFISYLLHPVMEVYADYCNFSFYNQESILRMIDYNMSPSFVLTKESSHLLTDTNSSNFYSTEYTLYEETIQNIYNEVNSVLKHTYNLNWINREVLADGVVVNTYEGGLKVVINYTNNEYSFNGQKVNPMSSEVFR